MAAAATKQQGMADARAASRASRASSEVSAEGAGAWESGALTPAQALRRYTEYLTPFEQSEILDYPHVFFIGRSGAPKVQGQPHSSQVRGACVGAALPYASHATRCRRGFQCELCHEDEGTPQTVFRTACPDQNVVVVLCCAVAQANSGYDDERGDYTIVNHDHLGYRYEILGILGKGSFGQVRPRTAYVVRHPLLS
jgi:dual specificity tyrosine-phosphorylation-regulated kinase 2/3/4